MKKIRIITRILLILVLLVHAGCMSSDSTSHGSIAGSVTDSSGNPLSGVKLSSPDASTYSDANGKWALTSLPAQTTEVSASREKYQTQKLTIEVLSGETVSNVTFVMPSDGDIYDVQVRAITSTQATVSFHTKKSARAHVLYGINALLDKTTVSDNQDLFAHQFVLSELTPASTYRFKCIAVDSAGRSLESDVKTFNTEYTLRPEAPSSLKLSKVSGSNIIKLDWDNNAGTDFSAFKIYRAQSAQGPYVAVGSVGLNSFSDNDVVPGVKYYYRVTKLSGSGDESAPSAVSAFLMYGAMSQNVVWTAQESPYQLSGDLIVPFGTSLMIDKGVSVSITKGNQWGEADANSLVDLTVQGTLVIQGTDELPVTFTSSESSPQSGDWNGITFDLAADLNSSSIKGLALSFAETGINGLAGIPNTIESKFFNCKQSAIQCNNARSDVLMQNLTVDTCAYGLQAKNNNVSVKMLDNKLLRCSYSIVCRDNKYAEIIGNRISFSIVSGIDVGNTDQTSVVKNNLVGYGSSGTGIICRGNDEIRRNTLHAVIGVEIKDSAKAVLRSNLLLVNRAKNGLGMLYSGAVAYNAATATNTVSIQNNAVWDVSEAAKKYANSNGTALTPVSADLSFTAAGPALQGGDPFVEFMNSSFSYVPSPQSLLKGAGYDFETIGAEDVSD